MCESSHEDLWSDSCALGASDSNVSRGQFYEILLVAHTKQRSRQLTCPRITYHLLS